ncbi:MAG TPA: hypothetical protein DEA08_33255 [Planctomycetes bacterium]|nr:hypothetical protein [Planctomycetota bacterium]
MAEPQEHPNRRATKRDIAAVFGVQPRTVNRWLEQGCPHSRDDRGRPRFDPGEVRAWREGGGTDAGMGGGTPPPESRATFARADLVRKVTQAKRSELELAAELELKDLGLDAKILAAKSYEDYVSIDLEIGALLARGALSPPRARAIQAVIADARQNTRAHLEAEGDEEPERLILLTKEGGALVRAFEGIVSDERREAILEHVFGEAEVDLEEFPNVDLTRAAQGSSDETEPEAPGSGGDEPQSAG